MNDCLIVKWWWKICTEGPGALWLKILKAKYFPNSSPLLASAVGGSQFWCSLCRLRDTFHLYVRFVVKDGMSVHFWLDLWSPVGRLCDVFPVLFSFCAKPDISISELAAAYWDFGFR